MSELKVAVYIVVALIVVAVIGGNLYSWAHSDENAQKTVDQVEQSASATP